MPETDARTLASVIVYKITDVCLCGLEKGNAHKVVRCRTVAISQEIIRIKVFNHSFPFFQTPRILHFEPLNETLHFVVPHDIPAATGVLNSIHTYNIPVCTIPPRTN